MSDSTVRTEKRMDLALQKTAQCEALKRDNAALRAALSQVDAQRRALEPRCDLLTRTSRIALLRLP